jgi:predicted small integral membrane protein
MMRHLFLLPLLVLPNAALAQSAVESKPFSWTDPLFPGFWMAWTPFTLMFFVFIFGSIAFMGFLEWRNPGGNPRLGILGLQTTRGDRLFIWLLGSAYIFLGWIGLVGLVLWGALAIVIAWGVFCFWKV